MLWLADELEHAIFAQIDGNLIKNIAEKSKNTK